MKNTIGVVRACVCVHGGNVVVCGCLLLHGCAFGRLGVFSIRSLLIGDLWTLVARRLASNAGCLTSTGCLPYSAVFMCSDRRGRLGGPIVGGAVLVWLCVMTV